MHRSFALYHLGRFFLLTIQILVGAAIGIVLCYPISFYLAWLVIKDDKRLREFFVSALAVIVILLPAYPYFTVWEKQQTEKKRQEQAEARDTELLNILANHGYFLREDKPVYTEIDWSLTVVVTAETNREGLNQDGSSKKGNKGGYPWTSQQASR